MAKVTVKLIKSLIGRNERQIRTANSLKLKKIGDTTVQEDNAVLAGKINIISHLVDVQEKLTDDSSDTDKN